MTARRKFSGKRVWRNAYNVIDADGHVLEPTTLWNDYMDPAFRDRAPRLIVDKDGGVPPGSAGQYRTLPGVLGKGMASRTLARPVT